MKSESPRDNKSLSNEPVGKAQNDGIVKISNIETLQQFSENTGNGTNTVNEEKSYLQYKYRWVILFIFCALKFFYGASTTFFNPLIGVIKEVILKLKEGV